jgi:leucyl-tRNA synthetase
LIKIKLIDFPDVLKEIADRNVYLLAATLRPETMYGQTNCYILPTGKYGAYEGKNGEVYIISERSALNMAYQDLLKEDRKIEKIAEVVG